MLRQEENKSELNMKSLSVTLFGVVENVRSRAFDHGGHGWCTSRNRN